MFPAISLHKCILFNLLIGFDVILSTKSNYATSHRLADTSGLYLPYEI